MNITPEYKYYILFCGLFQGKRNAVKQWTKYEPAFLSLVKADGEVGIKRLLQTLVLYFVKFSPEKQKFISTLMKQLYEQSVFSDTFVIGWANGDIKSDKKCALYDRKCEKVFRPLLAEFVTWLQQDYGDEEYGEEENKEEQQPEGQPAQEQQESEADKNMRLMIEQQKREQEEKLQAAKAKAMLEESKEEEPQSDQQVTDATKIAVEDEFDIDDI